MLENTYGENDKLSKDENSVSVDPTLFRSMIESLLYLTASRIDICFSVGVLHYIKVILKSYILL